MNLKITKQGAPIVNLDSIHINYQNEQVVLAEIDMQSKWCEIAYVAYSDDGYLGFAVVNETNRSTQLSDKLEKETEVQIADYTSLEWTIFNITRNRYTVRITLLRKVKNGNKS